MSKELKQQRLIDDLINALENLNLWSPAILQSLETSFGKDQTYLDYEKDAKAATEVLRFAVQQKLKPQLIMTDGQHVTKPN